MRYLTPTAVPMRNVLSVPLSHKREASPLDVTLAVTCVPGSWHTDNMLGSRGCQSRCCSPRLQALTWMCRVTIPVPPCHFLQKWRGRELQPCLKPLGPFAWS